jgi:hypothetical protein
MNQVGTIKTFSLSVPPPADSGVYSYVWRFWDGTVAVTSVPTVQKTLNIGGDPVDSRKLYFTCTPVMEDGRSTVITGSVIVNNAPYIVPSPEISNNDDFFPYATQIDLTAYDVENDSIAFLYYDSGGNPIGGGVSSYVGNVTGTWNGTAGIFNGTHNVFTTVIQSETAIVLKVVDAASGTRVIDFNFYGETAPQPVIGVTAEAADTLTADASSIPDQRIGPGQSINFTVYASDPVSSNFDFLWSFYGSFGWSINSFASGTSTPAADGSVRNSYTKDIAAETGGNKTVLVKVTNINSGKDVEIPLYVALIGNSVAATATFTITDENGNAYADGGSVVAGRKLHFKAVAVDPQRDVVQYKWTIVQPSGINPATLRMWGSEVVLDTTGYPSGYIVTGTLLVIDRMQGEASFTVPSLTVT